MAAQPEAIFSFTDMAYDGQPIETPAAPTTQPYGPFRRDPRVIKALQSAVSVAGSETKLYGVTGVDRRHFWMVRNGYARGLPPERAQAIARATGVPLEDLCPTGSET